MIMAMHFEVGGDASNFSMLLGVAMACLFFHSWDGPSVVCISFDCSFPMGEPSLMFSP